MLASKREALVDAIGQIRAQSTALPPLVEKAHRLMLSRYWAKADWRRRAQLVATSEWLLRLAEMSGEINRSGLL